jgi:membrane-associated phospholipid phosphatase
VGRRTGWQDPGGPLLAPAPRWTPLLAERTRGLAAAVLVACIALTALLGLLFYHQHQPDALDAAIDDWIGSALSSHAAVDVLQVVVMLGEPAWVAALTVVLLAACLVTRRLRGALLAAVSVPVAGALSDLVIKPFVGRIYGLSSLTFPSGHATGVFTIAAVLAVLLLGPQYSQVPVRLRSWLVLACYAVCAAVSVTLVALDFHYFTDTVAGAATATAVVLATAFVLDLPLLRRLVPGWLKRSPPPSRAAGDPVTGRPPDSPGRRLAATTDRMDGP